MQRWAELVIVEVKKDENDSITHVKIKIDAVNRLIGEIEMTKEEIILLLRNKIKIKTAYKYKKFDPLIQIKTNINFLINPELLAETPKEKSGYLEGAEVEYYKSNGVEYLRTSSNASSEDNLDYLPTY